MLHAKVNKVGVNWKAFLKSPNLLSNSVRLFLLVAFPIVAYFQDFIQLFSLALADPEIQYVLLVPFIVAFFFYKRRKAFLISRENSLIHYLTGIFLCLLALLIYVWGSYSFYPLQFHLISLPIFVAGIILLVFGADTLRILIFPTLLLFFLSPFPLLFSDTFGGYLIDSVATLAASILRLFFSIELSYRPIVILSTYTSTGQKISFELATACSGIYSLTAIGFFAVVFLFIVSGSLAKKAVFASLSLFTTYMLNVLRIILTVVLGYFFGYSLAVDFFHLFGGVVILFFGALLLIYISDRLLKMPLFQGKLPSECPHCNTYDNLCYRCGRVIKLPKIGFESKRLAIVFLFLLVVANLVFQASAINYNRVVKDENTSMGFNPYTGQITAFSNLSGWSVLFLGREYEAEERLGMYYVGDYVLYREDSLKEISAILELSDVQSKFHIWEGCLNYQSFEINIEKRYFSTIYDENNVIVTAETLIADVPAYKQKIIVLSWFDSLNLKINGTTNVWAVKVSLLKSIYKQDNQTNTNNIETVSNELLTLGKEIEKYWGSYKNSPTSFVVDLYRNKELFTAFILGMLVVSTAILQMQSLLMKSRFSKKIAELSEEDLNFLKSNSGKTTSFEENEKKEKQACYKTDIANKIAKLKEKGILQEQIIMKNGQLYVKWKSFY